MTLAGSTQLYSLEDYRQREERAEGRHEYRDGEIVEALSQSTEAYDRGDKFRFYRSIPSFREYFLVSQSGALVEQYVKTEAGDWRLRGYEGMEAEVPLGIGLGSLVMAEIYEDVALGGEG